MGNEGLFCCMLDPGAFGLYFAFVGVIDWALNALLEFLDFIIVLSMALMEELVEASVELYEA